jgi:hypothetical protein
MGDRHFHPVPNKAREWFDENTLFKVYDSLRAAGLEEQQARDAITDMHNKGILFRERGPELVHYDGPIMRGDT